MLLKFKLVKSSIVKYFTNLKIAEKGRPGWFPNPVPVIPVTSDDLRLFRSMHWRQIESQSNNVKLLVGGIATPKTWVDIWIIYGYYMVIIWLMMVNNYLVGGLNLPLLKIRVRQSVGMIFHSQLNGKIKSVPNHQPVHNPVKVPEFYQSSIFHLFSIEFTHVPAIFQ